MDQIGSLQHRGVKAVLEAAPFTVRYANLAVCPLTNDPLSIRENVTEGSEVFTDALKSYDDLADAYIHGVVDHAEAYVKGHVHTNGLENFWSLLKRAIRGTYVNVEPFHLFRYLDEEAFRFNTRKTNDGSRFQKVTGSITGKRLTYRQLTGKAVATT